MSKFKKGQSVIELLIATAIFAMVAASIIFLVLGAHLSNQQGKEIRPKD